MATVALSPAELASHGIPEKHAIVAPTKRPVLTAEQVALHKAMHASFQAAHGADAKLKTFLDEACIMRYLWAHQFDEAKARKNLEDTVAWRKEYMTDAMFCALCATDDKHHCFVPIGVDRFGRPIMYVCPARSLSADGPETMRHVVAEMEAVHAAGMAAAAASAGGDAGATASTGSSGSASPAMMSETWVWIMDLRGFSVFGSGFSLSLGKSFVNIFTAHYPERLGVMLLLEPPYLLSALIAGLKAVMDPVTVRKLAVIGAADLPEVVKILARTDTQAEWMHAAMRSETTPGKLPALPPDAKVPEHKVIPARLAGATAAAGVSATPKATGGAGTPA